MIDKGGRKDGERQGKGSKATEEPIKTFTYSSSESWESRDLMIYVKNCGRRHRSPPLPPRPPPPPPPPPPPSSLPLATPFSHVSLLADASVMTGPHWLMAHNSKNGRAARKIFFLS